MQNLPFWLPWVVIVFALISLIGLVWYLFFGGEDEEDVTEDLVGADTLSITAAEGAFKDTLATTAEELRTTARESRIIALKQSLERSLDSRESRAHAPAKDRMSMPWFMLVGADGSGKKTILGNTGLPLPWGPPLEVDSHRKDAGKWWLFEDAVVLEAPAAAPGPTAIAATLPPDQTVADTSVGWNTLLHMLRRDRPDSPLNGIIITISCLELLNARNNPERLEEQADRISNFLTRTRNFLGVRLPIHVLVTKCDTLPGFRGFAAALPEKRRHDIFGWANPHDPEKPFESSWIDTGFTRLLGQVSDLRDEALAAPEVVEDSTGVFIFDNEFADLQDSLKAFIARIIPIGERRPSLFFRGFYFTGDVLEGAPANDSAPTLIEPSPRSNTRISTELAAEPHDLVFLRALFADKIFKEAGLARPMSRWRLSRDRRVVLAQAASLLIALVGSAGLWTAINGWRREGLVFQAGLRADAAILTRVLSGVAIDLDEVRFGAGPASPVDRRARDAAVIELVAQMRDVPTGGVRSPFIPTSWFSSLPGDIEQSMLAGLQSIVLPVTRQRLEERTSRLLGAATASAAGVADGSVTQSGEDAEPFDPRAVSTYLQDVRVLSRNIERYNSLADSSTGNVAELSALLDYLFGEQITADSVLATADFEAALRRASAPGIAITPGMAATVVNRAVAMVSTVGEDAARQLAAAPTAAAERAIKPADDLRALNGLASLVRLMDAKEGLVATVSDSTILGTRLARAVEDSIGTRFKRAAWRIVGDTVAPDSAAARLRATIERLYQYRLMERSEGMGGREIVSEIRPNQRLRWDIGRLELALALPAEYLQAVVTISDALPGRNPDRLRRALGVQLRERSLDVVASAQRFTPLGPKADTLMEVRTSGLNLEAAAPRLVRLSQSFDTLDAGREGRKLMIAGARQAERAIAMAQRIFDGWNFVPHTARIATWQGVQPLSFAALGVTTDTLEQVSKMLQYTTDLRALTTYVAPAIRYLRSTGAGDSVRVPALLSRWEGITIASQKEARGDASSTLGMLMYFVRETMSMRDLASCTAKASEPDTARTTGDVFLIKRRQFRAAMVSRCGTGGASEAIASYQRLRSQFQSRLAGRYPFADSTYTVRGGAEADAASVREFFRQFDAFRLVDDVALRSHPTLSQTAKAAIAFLDQLAAVRSFVAPFVDSGSVRTVPAYSILATMSISPDTLPNYLLDLDVGGRQATVDENAIEHLWRAGDSVKVILSPLDTSSARTLYAAGGNWAAVRFLRAAPAGMSVKAYHPETKLELQVPVFPAVAPEILVPRSR
jgi:type VI secretion system protein ImpL